MLKATILIAALFISGCASKPAYKCTADNAAIDIRKTESELEAETERLANKASPDGHDLLLLVRRRGAQLSLLYARFSAKDGEIQEACETMLRVRADPDLQMQFSPL